MRVETSEMGLVAIEKLGGTVLADGQVFWQTEIVGVRVRCCSVLDDRCLLRSLPVLRRWGPCRECLGLSALR